MHPRPAPPTDAEPTAPIAVATPATPAADPTARTDAGVSRDEPTEPTAVPAPLRTVRRNRTEPEHRTEPERRTEPEHRTEPRRRTWLVRPIALAQRTGTVGRPALAQQTGTVGGAGMARQTRTVGGVALAQQTGTVGRAAVVRVLLAVVAAVLVSGGCAISVGSGGGGDSGGGSSSDNPINSVNRDDLDEDERSAVNATNAFWRQVFPEDFRRTYVPAQVEGGYLGEDGPTCGGQPSVSFNAFYCPSQDFLAWDENLMAAGYRQIGDAWVYLIIAHEWGHAIQARLRADQVSVAAELQADCFAGATLFGAADRGLLTFERGDIQELQQTLVAVADDFPWTKESDHGDARQRIDAFNQGAQGGVTSCIR